MDTLTEAPNASKHAGCLPVTNETGDATELANDHAYKDIMDGIAKVQIDIRLSGVGKPTEGKFGTEIDRGRTAVEAMKSLGCAACLLSGDCLVETALDTTIKTGVHDESWQAELNRIEKNEKFIDSLSSAQRNAFLSDIDKLRNQPENSESISHTLWEVELAFTKTQKKKDIDEIKDINAIDANADLPIFSLTTDDGRTIEFIDASDAMHTGRDPLTQDALRTLYTKLFSRIVKKDSKNNPLIQSEGDKAQTKIKAAEKNPTYEIRTGGDKERMYFIYPKPVKGKPAKIIILGFSGGIDAQNEFIDSIV